MATNPTYDAVVDAWRQIEGIVGPARVRAATAEDAILGVQPRYVVEPENAEQIARVLAVATAGGLKVAPRGGGSKIEWGNAPRALDLVISTRAMAAVVEHAWEDLTVTVQPGCTVANLQRTLAQHGQRLAIDPLFPEQATIGGILATADGGPLRTRFGSLRDLVIGITAALPDGTLARSGGRVVKNVAGYDLPKLFTGAYGTLGIIAEATFRLHPLPPQARTLTFLCASLKDANRSLLALQDSILVHTSLQIRCARDRITYLDVRFEGIPDSVTQQAERAPSLVHGNQVETENNVWRAREELWMRTETGCICRFSALPAELADLFGRIDQIAEEFHVDWRSIVQAVGVGLVRLEGDSQQLAHAVGRLRIELEHAGGSLLMLRCAEAMRGPIDVWGSGGSAMPLMRRVKQQFDPAGTMNPGRFVGGI